MENLNGIKNVIFDLGGVLLNIDFSKTFDAFAALGIRDAHRLNDREEVLQLFMDLEIGKYDQASFLKRFRELVLYPSDPSAGMSSGVTSSDISDEQLIDAFNALLLDYPPERIARVQELSKTYRTFLLSNTNEIHAACYNARLKEEFGIESLDHLMERAFYSHKLGFRKPDSRIYTSALQLAGIRAEESLFVDDTEENVEAARKLGIKAVMVEDFFTNPQPITHNP